MLWAYDAVGSYGDSKFECAGNGSSMMQSLIDNQFQQYNQIKKSQKKSPEEALEILVDAFQSVAERDTTSGDSVEFLILKKNKILMKKVYPLRRDWLNLIILYKFKIKNLEKDKKTLSLLECQNIWYL